MWRISFLLNWLTGGSIRHLLCYRLYEEDKRFWMWVINTIFNDELHVYRAWRWQRVENWRRERREKTH